jgi:integrase
VDPQIVVRNNLGGLVAADVDSDEIDGLARWAEAYFRFEATTAPASQAVQRRDLALFLGFVRAEAGCDRRVAWTPRLSRAFVEALRKELAATDGRRRYGDRTVNRVLAHLKTFAKWIHRHRPFPLGDPMVRLRALSTAGLLAIERALTPTERRRLLDAADLLVQVGGRSRDRARYGRGNATGAERPRRKGYRPWRNRAVVDLLIETGMRRAAAVNLDLDGVDLRAGAVTVAEKGGARHTYQVSREGLDALRDYMERERPALFLPAATNARGRDRLSPLAVNRIWAEACKLAGVEGKTPHAARHAMGRHIIAKTGNIAAVQRQLGHRNAAYSMQYARITAEELSAVLNDR